MLAQDLVYAVRTFRRWPGFTAVAVITLALGIGANTAIFSVVDGVLLRPLPFPQPDRLVLVWERNDDLNLPYMYASPPNLADWMSQSTTFSAIGGFTVDDFTVRLGDAPERMLGGRMTANLLPLLGIDPLHGRGFTAEEDRPDGPRVLLLGHGLWQRRFAGADVVGQTVLVNDLPHEIVGVMPPGFAFPPPIVLESSLVSPPTEFWVPLAYDLPNGQRGAHHVTALGRLAPEAAFEQAGAEMHAIAARLAQAYPSSNAGWDIVLVPLVEGVVRDVRPALLVLLGAVGFVLLQACVNVANLLMTRAVGRQREVAIRASLGASRGRLVRQLLTENLLLALAGGGAGLILAAWGVRMLVRLAPAGIPRIDEVGLNPRVLVFTLATSVLAGLLFGLAPALGVRNARLSDWLRDRDAGGERSQSRALRHGLVVLEVALAMILLVGAGLMIRSFQQLRRVDPGFSPAQVLTFRTALPSGTFSGQPDRRVAFVSDALERLRAVPAVESVGATTEIPFVHDRQGTSLWREEQAPPTGAADRVVNWAIVSPGYFETMGIPLVRGRSFVAADRPDSAPVIVVDEAVATTWFPGEDAIGKRVFFGASHGTAREIVGVVGRERHATLGTDPNPGVYLPYLQWPNRLEVSFVVRTSTTAAVAADSARAAIRAANGSVPVFDVQTLDQVLADATAQPRFSALLLSLFATTALLLAAVGIYGVMSYAVSQRTHEIGVRVALGAQPAQIRRLVIGQAMTFAALGMLFGGLGALALGRTLSSLLFQVGPTDGRVFLLVTTVLAAVALVACYVPARRATRVDPMMALRTE